MATAALEGLAGADMEREATDLTGGKKKEKRGKKGKKRKKRKKEKKREK